MAAVNGPFTTVNVVSLAKFILSTVVTPGYGCPPRQYPKHPAGYGFFKYKVENGITTWQSFNCCD